MCIDGKESSRSKTEKGRDETPQKKTPILRLRIGYIINTCKANHTDTPPKKTSSIVSGAKTATNSADMVCCTRAVGNLH